ncbi:hypothetical protein ACJMK2_039674 [Sinanodonta woodiana]|uniref:Helicase SKI2W n=1 Tax=Sinanodonta woodiana TaxID=1069815 RepID=A0ABD3WGP7_SINWO
MALAEIDFAFDLVEIGCSGQTEVVPSRDKVFEKVHLPLKTLPFGVPPVLLPLEKEIEKCLTSSEVLPIHDFKWAQRFLPREKDPRSLFHTDVCPVQTSIQVERNPTTGKLLGYKEEFISDTGSTSRNSLSLNRPPGPQSQDVRGSSLNIPFWPGGLDEPELETLFNQKTENDINFDKDLLTVAPGLTTGITFKRETTDSGDAKSRQTGGITQDLGLLNITDLLLEDEFFDLGESDEEEEQVIEQKQTGAQENIELQGSEKLETLVKVGEKAESQETKVKTVSSQGPIEEWAFEVDINTPVGDFYKKIPDMAHKWSFELDVFQKQAILHLESHESVFVAAHTSAGKTVVAEYAIALSLKCMTRTIYTSPIKALSNQKYRDFKKTFGDVGLITGDVQLNQTAACLIMTTEILRSMLYNGSDVVRDLEWVIFDEVHYINDSERGVVWEEVLIMLPQHVNIILLSATVPNPLEFASWIGRTKRKKIYVISTTKRPVPLEHYLFTGSGGKTNSELFKIVDEKGNFLTIGYSKALETKQEKGNKSVTKGQKGGSFSQEKNIWLSLVDMLKKKEKLPVVAFVFSKKRINELVGNLNTLDLTTATEKSEIHIFFHKSISRLKGSDKELPQVTQMEDILKRGLGSHHSGILPILKEVVELLFQRGLVKILFATETFAMGVNMPAKTVVFDSIRKHDGTNFRNLVPGEYVQMAGRAGRRGLDTTGTVIILCKGDIPEMADLHKMMLGKPTKLESQFRLTYSMILNLLRVEKLRVEDMIKRSFSEYHNQKDISKHKQALDELQIKLKDMQNIECYMCAIDLEAYWEACRDYKSLKEHLQSVVITHPAALKALSPGRVVVVNTDYHRNALGVVLKFFLGLKNEKLFTCLVICDKNITENTKEKVDEDKGKINFSSDVQPMTNVGLFIPESPCWHDVVDLSGEQISVITTKTLKIEVDKIINDFKKRSQPRFKDDPPGKAISQTTQELLRLAEGNPKGLEEFDLNLRDIELVEQFRSLQFLRDKSDTYQCIHCPTFTEHFKQINRNMRLKEEYKRLKFLLSDESLILLPEYQQRIQVLKNVGYCDDNNTVQLKGRVACEISNHELMITELVFENALTELHPTEIAAILSCVVFEQKKCSEPKLIDTLEKGQERIKEIARNISRLQRAAGMQLAGEYEEEFHFGLMEVVFEWARGMPFSEITKLTDVQEGIIVRSIHRLHETLRDVRNAARIIGDPVLYRKIDEASAMIKRDIVFAASLYTQ